MTMPPKRGRRKKRKKQAKPAFNVVDFGFGWIAADAVTRATVGTGIKDFLFTGWTGPLGNAAPSTINNSNEVSLAEMFRSPSWGISSSFGQDGSFMDVVQHNLMKNGWRSGITLLVLPIAKKVVKKGIAPLTRPTNRALKTLGIKAVKV
jgi:hypothetical protein